MIHDSQRKELLIAILQKLQPYRDKAEGFLAFVQSETCSQTSVNELIRVIHDAIQTIKQVHSIHIVNQLHLSHDIIAHQDIDEAESMLDNL